MDVQMMFWRLDVEMYLAVMKCGGVTEEGEKCGGVRCGAQAVTGRGRPAQAARRSGLSLPRER